MTLLNRIRRVLGLVPEVEAEGYVESALHGMIVWVNFPICDEGEHKKCKARAKMQPYGTAICICACHDVVRDDLPKKILS